MIGNDRTCWSGQISGITRTSRVDRRLTAVGIMLIPVVPATDYRDVASLVYHGKTIALLGPRFKPAVMPELIERTDV